jgi:hypothetical protein
MRCKAGRAGQSSAGPAQHSTARHSAACYSEAADPTANSGGRRSTCSKLVMEDAKEQHSRDLGHQHHGALSIGDGQDVPKPNG